MRSLLLLLALLILSGDLAATVPGVWAMPSEAVGSSVSLTPRTEAMKTLVRTERERRLAALLLLAALSTRRN